MLPAHIKWLREIINHPANSGRKLSTLLRYLKWNIGRRLLDEADYSVELVPGCRLVLSNRENYATLAYLCHLYDFEDMLFTLHFLNEGTAFGDFGANVGVYSILAGSRAADVLSVEPIPDTYRRLKENLRLNGVRGSAINCGLADKPSILRFTTDQGGMNQVARPGDKNICEVDVTTADELSLRTGIRPVLLKIDVEGYEWPVLAGAADLLAHHVNALIVELNGTGRQFGYSDSSVDELLRAKGFGPYRYDPTRRTLTQLDAINRDGFNTLYLRRDFEAEIGKAVRSALPVVLPFGTF